MGSGNSPYVEYTGTGLYKLKQISPTEIKSGNIYFLNKI